MDPNILVAAVMFVGASISDLQTRRVPNRYWLPFVIAAVLLALPSPGAPSMWGAAALGAGVFYVLWRAGLFGGADAKGLMVAAFLLPSTPDLLANRTLLALDALVNATLLMLALPVLFLVWNVFRGDLRLPAAVLGVRMDLARARTRHLWPMQQAAGGGLRWRYLHRPGSDVEATFTGLARAGVERPWVTPKIPFMVPLTAGLLVAFWHGNLVLRAMATILG